LSTSPILDSCPKSPIFKDVQLGVIRAIPKHEEGEDTQMESLMNGALL